MPWARHSTENGVEVALSRDTRTPATEPPDEATKDLDTLSSLEIARIINAEDRRVPMAIEHALPEIARTIDAVAEALRNGGRLIHVGTCTSGRLGALDASECPPTFNSKPQSRSVPVAVLMHHAGVTRACAERLLAE